MASIVRAAKVSNVLKLFMAVIYECLYMASLSNLVYCLFVKQEPTSLKNLSGEPL